MASFVHDLGIVLGVATGTSIICRKLNQPSILGFLAAGLIVGPYIPIPLFADTDRVHTLSEFGVVLVMFYIGLEFQLSKLFKVLPVAGFSALIEIGTMLFLGFSIGLGLGWSHIESVFLGACICISSTMLVSKIFEDAPTIGADVRTFVLGILVLQDVAAIALIAAMTAVAESGSVSIQGLSLTLGKLLLTLTLMIAFGLPLVPRLVRHVMTFKSNEVVIISAIGLCFSFSLLAESLGYSVALGAFVAGVLVSESGHGHDIVHTIQPVKDIFAAVFFVSIGMTVEPQLALQNIGPSLVVFVAVVIFQLLSISIAGVLSGNGLQKSLKSGLSLGQIGEFGFIIAAIGIGAGVVRPGLQPIMVTVAVITAFTTPQAVKFAPRLVAFVDHNLPNRLKNSIVVYEGWISGLRTVSAGPGQSPRRKAVRAITFDAVLWVLGTAVFMYGFNPIAAFIVETLDVTLVRAKMVSFLAFFVLSIPLLIGIVRNTHRLVESILQGIAERRARANTKITPIGASLLRASIHVLVMMGVGIPAAVVLLPFVGSAAVIALVAAGMILMMGLLWRSAGRFDAEIRSEAERLIAFLNRQRTDGVSEQAPQAFFPDLDKMDGIFILEGLPVIGKTLSELNLRARSGALVVAIHREGTDVVLPTGSEEIRADDLLFVTGTEEAVAKARTLITAPTEEAFAPEESRPA